MKEVKRLVSKFMVFVLLMIFAISPIVEVSAASKLPEIESAVTEKNILCLVEKYDKDSAYILKKRIKKGAQITVWFVEGRIIDDIDTAVHEETHGYRHSYSKGIEETAYFVGNGKTIYVPQTNVFHSKKMAGTIPKQLRTFRYDTYVAKPVPYLSANVDGAYGLLNEFMAYRMGMSNAIALYPYYTSQNAGWEDWEVWINQCENDQLAYAEFKYYILHYLAYAKTHEPKVYKGIINNKQFCKAYTIMEKSYAKLIKEYENDLKKIQEYLTKKGGKITITDDDVTFYIQDGRLEIGSGVGRYTSDYTNLQKEMKKKTYQSIHKTLVKNG